MEIPSNLHYTKDHEWVSNQSGTAKIGISSFAVEQLGDIVHVDFPEVGDSFDAGEAFGTIESTKTVSDLNMPLGGKVVEINNAVEEDPESLQSDSYKNGWLIKVELSSNTESSDLMKAADYESFIKNS
jgi:glycine cleavage system H protein